MSATPATFTHDNVATFAAARKVLPPSRLQWTPPSLVAQMFPLMCLYLPFSKVASKSGDRKIPCKSGWMLSPGSSGSQSDASVGSRGATKVCARCGL